MPRNYEQKNDHGSKLVPLNKVQIRAFEMRRKLLGEKVDIKFMGTLCTAFQPAGFLPRLCSPACFALLAQLPTSEWVSECCCRRRRWCCCCRFPRSRSRSTTSEKSEMLNMTLYTAPSQVGKNEWRTEMLLLPPPVACLLCLLALLASPPGTTFQSFFLYSSILGLGPTQSR